MNSKGVAKAFIQNFSLMESDFVNITSCQNVQIRGRGKVFCREGTIQAKLNINFSNSRGSKIFWGVILKAIYQL